MPRGRPTRRLNREELLPRRLLEDRPNAFFTPIAPPSPPLRTQTGTWENPIFVDTPPPRSTATTPMTTPVADTPEEVDIDFTPPADTPTDEGSVGSDETIDLQEQENERKKIVADVNRVCNVVISGLTEVVDNVEQAQSDCEASWFNNDLQAYHICGALRLAMSRLEYEQERLRSAYEDALGDNNFEALFNKYKDYQVTYRTHAIATNMENGNTLA